MITESFDLNYDLVETTVKICEDTARCVVQFPRWNNKDRIIEFINKNNYICAGVYSTDEDLLKEMNIYLGGEMITTLEEYNLIERQFT